MVHMLTKILNGNVRIFMTKCIKKSVEQLGLKIPKLTYLKCNHGSNDSEECIKSVIEENPKYFIAVQDETLRKELAKIPGIPLLYLTNNVMMLEPPSLASKKLVQERGEQHTNAPRNIVKMARKVSKEIHQEENESDTKQYNSALRYLNRNNTKAKGPNPLSVKKKQKKITDQNEPKPDAEKKKRKRKRTRNKEDNNNKNKNDTNIENNNSNETFIDIGEEVDNIDEQIISDEDQYHPKKKEK